MISGGRTYSSGGPNKQNENCQLAEKTRGLFLDEVLPLSQNVPKRSDSRKGSLQENKGERGSYVRAIRKHSSCFYCVPHLHLVDRCGGTIRPPVEVHRHTLIQFTQRDKLAPDLSIPSMINGKPGATKTDFSKMDLFVEFKTAESSDRFCDQPDGEDRRNFASRKT